MTNFFSLLQTHNFTLEVIVVRQNLMNVDNHLKITSKSHNCNMGLQKQQCISYYLNVSWWILHNGLPYQLAHITFLHINIEYDGVGNHSQEWSERKWTQPLFHVILKQNHTNLSFGTTHFTSTYCCNTNSVKNYLIIITNSFWIPVLPHFY